MSKDTSTAIVICDANPENASHWMNNIELTPIQNSLLIWLYNNKHLVTIDQGNLLHAYQEITENPNYSLESFLNDVAALINRKLIETHCLDTFYKITEAGIKYIDAKCPPQLIFQCDRCGDIWSPDIDDPMILEAYLSEHPDGHVAIEECESCEQEYYDPEEDEDYEIQGAAIAHTQEVSGTIYIQQSEDADLHALFKALVDEADDS